jgi:hypothetical protein
MESKLLRCLALVVGLLTVCSPMFAHHGSAVFAANETVLKDATVTKVIWANPHVIVEFDVKDENGNIVHWASEASSPPGLVQVGWSRNALQAGDVVTVYLHPAKSGKPVAWLTKVVLPGGKELCGMPTGGTGYCGKTLTPNP